LEKENFIIVEKGVILVVNLIHAIFWIRLRKIID